MKATVKVVKESGHAYLSCTITDVPMGARVVTEGEVKEDYAVMSVQTREQLMGLGLGYVACPQLTVYNGAARLAYKTAPQNLASVAGPLQIADFVTQLDALKSEKDAKALVVMVELPQGMFLSHAVKMRIMKEWAIGGNFDREHEWHLIIPNMRLRECFLELADSMPNVYTHEHIQEALGFKGNRPTVTMTVNVKGGSARHMIMPGFSPRRRHDGSYEVKGVASDTVNFDLLLLMYGDAWQLEVQLDGAEVPVTLEVTPDKSWLSDADFLFYLANRRPTPSPMGKMLLQELAAESGGGGASADFNASGAEFGKPMQRSASVFGSQCW